MNIYQLYLDLLYNPLAIKTYRDLERYYREQGMTAEANAFAELNEANNRPDYSGERQS